MSEPIIRCPGCDCGAGPHFFRRPDGEGDWHCVSCDTHYMDDDLADPDALADGEDRLGGALDVCPLTAPVYKVREALALLGVPIQSEDEAELRDALDCAQLDHGARATHAGLGGTWEPEPEVALPASRTAPGDDLLAAVHAIARREF